MLRDEAQPKGVAGGANALNHVLLRGGSTSEDFGSFPIASERLESGCNSQAAP